MKRKASASSLRGEIEFGAISSSAQLEVIRADTIFVRPAKTRQYLRTSSGSALQLDKEVVVVVQGQEYRITTDTPPEG